MKVVCHQCRARYNIKDERVRGKTLKIRCKKCGAVMTVSAAAQRFAAGKASAESTAPAAAPSGASPLESRFAASFQKGEGPVPGLYDAVKRSASQMEKKPEELACWFVAVDGSPVGPVSARKIAALEQGGKVGPESLVWKEGMPDWMPLAQCGELRAALDAVRSAQERAAAADPKLPLFGPSKDVQPTDVLRGERLGEVGAREEEGAREGDDAPTAASPEPSAAPQDDPLAAWAASYGGDVSTVSSISPPSPAGKAVSWKLAAAVVFFVVCVGVFVAVIFTGKNTPETVIREKIVEKTKVVYRDRPVPVAAEPSQRGDQAQAERERRTEGVRRTKSRLGAKQSRAPRKETEEERKQRLLREMLSSPDTPGVAPLSALKGRDRPQPGQGLTQKQMSQVVGRHRSALQLCYERSLKRGTTPVDKDLKVVFDVAVGSSGMVKSVRLSGSGSSYTDLRNCLIASVKRWVFPASGASSSLQFPIVFTPSR